MDNIRDHFAGLAMQAIIQSEQYTEATEYLSVIGEGVEIQDAVAMLAYAQAEAMIKVRNKLNEETSEQSAPKR